MSQTEYSEPISRRDAWLTVALAVARDGLPVPEHVTLPTGYPNVHIDVADAQEALAWGKHLGLVQDESLVRSDGKGLIIRWDGWTPRDGWTYHVRATEPIRQQSAPEPQSPLAAEVVAAILTPDAPSLPEAVAA